jgi:hypothetical protein
MFCNDRRDNIRNYRSPLISFLTEPKGNIRLLISSPQPSQTFLLPTFLFNDYIIPHRLPVINMKHMNYFAVTTIKQHFLHKKAENIPFQNLITAG